jgi:hypothetical protein
LLRTLIVEKEKRKGYREIQDHVVLNDAITMLLVSFVMSVSGEFGRQSANFVTNSHGPAKCLI